MGEFIGVIQGDTIVQTNYSSKSLGLMVLPYGRVMQDVWYQQYMLTVWHRHSMS